MKVVDGNSKIGRKLEEWFAYDEQEASQHDEKDIEWLKEKNQRRNRLPVADVSPTRLEKKIVKWFIASEEDERPLIIEERLGPHHHKVLALTYFRAILFEAGWFGRLRDISDKIWRQFISVHLAEERFLSSLELRFFHYHGSVTYHNPFNDKSSLDKDEFITWELNNLDKHQARRVYSYLKDKELYWQEKRREEYIEQQKMLMMRPPGGAPPPKKPDTKDT